jgi:hypothetical protein
MQIDLTDDERVLLLTLLDREVQEKNEVASAPGVAGTPNAENCLRRVAACQALIGKFERARTFKAAMVMAADSLNAEEPDDWSPEDPTTFRKKIDDGS